MRQLILTVIHLDVEHPDLTVVQNLRPAISGEHAQSDIIRTAGALDSRDRRAIDDYCRISLNNIVGIWFPGHADRGGTSACRLVLALEVSSAAAALTEIWIPGPGTRQNMTVRAVSDPAHRLYAVFHMIHRGSKNAGVNITIRPGGFNHCKLRVSARQGNLRLCDIVVNGNAERGGLILIRHRNCLCGNIILACGQLKRSA